ncbi:CHAT domain-containing protein [Microcoleus sp. S36b_A3]|uniref:CHAT domain-containing tetratricopeptide repeat protein n=1 Tax=unclassified Microcoleus TaxID=2642155 RepID=UPI002FD71252
MTWTVILALGSGNLLEGFPHITAQLQNQARSISIQQFKGSLPPAPDIEVLHRRWKAACTGLQSSRSDARIKVNYASTTHISETNPGAIYEGLKKEIQSWLKTDDFYSKIEVKLRTRIGNPSEAAVQIFLECDDSRISELPWDAWNFREEYRQSEIIRSSSEYTIPHRQETQVGINLASRGRILCILGNSKGINVTKDRRIIEKSLGDSCQLEFLDNPTLEDFNDRLFDEKGWQIFFFAGHSNSDDNATNGRLHINQNPTNNTVTVKDLKLGVQQASFKGLQLLIFNSCSSFGLAADLVAQNHHLPSIIVMRAPIPDQIAHDFVKSLLRYLAEGDLLFLAMRKAKDDLQRWESRFPGASGIPVLCQDPNFEELTLPGCGAAKPVISAADGAAPRPNRPQFTVSTKFMQRTSISLAVLAIGYPLTGPNLADAINAFGRENHRKNQFLAAKISYNLAALINPINGEPYYNLSELCKQLSDRQCEREAMQSAVWRGLPEAHAQISKSFLLENKPEDVLNAIGLCLKTTKYDGVKSACFKNRGWLRFTQKRYNSAEADLRTAISLNSNSPEAQCFLAQVLETKGKVQESLRYWQQTLNHANSSIPEQDECLEMAKDRLQILGKSK